LRKEFCTGPGRRNKQILSEFRLHAGGKPNLSLRVRSMRALALLSGGLDSILAARLIREQGVEVVGIGFSSPFFDCRKGEEAAREMEIDFHCFDLSARFLQMMEHPPHGYGKNLNPCVDCHRLMVKEAFSRMERLGADFVITGEVLGQRPKSQNRAALRAVAGAGAPGLLLRPLSAKLLEETVAEKEGWVNRSRLLGLSGRGRKKQLELAERFGIKNYSSPGGGCLLTESEFCRRLKELKKHEGWKRRRIELLRLGRHFRLPSGARAVSGRDERENKELARRAVVGDYLFQAAGRPGSLVLLRKKTKPDRKDLELAASICARYSKEKSSSELKIRCWKKNENGDERIINARPMVEEELEGMRI